MATGYIKGSKKANDTMMALGIYKEMHDVPRIWEKIYLPYLLNARSRSRERVREDKCPT